VRELKGLGYTTGAVPRRRVSAGGPAAAGWDCRSSSSSPVDAESEGTERSEGGELDEGVIQRNGERNRQTVWRGKTVLIQNRI